MAVLGGFRHRCCGRLWFDAGSRPSASSSLRLFAFGLGRLGCARRRCWNGARGSVGGGGIRVSVRSRDLQRNWHASVNRQRHVRGLRLRVQCFRRLARGAPQTVDDLRLLALGFDFFGLDRLLARRGTFRLRRLAERSSSANGNEQNYCGESGSAPSDGVHLKIGGRAKSERPAYAGLWSV